MTLGGVVVCFVLMWMFVVRGGLIALGDGEVASCDRFVFLIGGSPVSPLGVGGDGWEAARDRLGTWMPSSDSDSDFLRVLYGIVAVLKYHKRRVVERRMHGESAVMVVTILVARQQL